MYSDRGPGRRGQAEVEVREEADRREVNVGRGKTSLLNTLSFQRKTRGSEEVGEIRPLGLSQVF